MNKNIIKNIMKLFIIIILSYILGFFISNFNILINSDSIGIKNIERKIIETTKIKKVKDKYVFLEEESLLTIKIDGQYINKLIFKYKSDEDFNWELKYKELDYYGNYKEKTIIGTSSNKINIFSEKINSKVKDISFTLDKTNVEISDINVSNEINILPNKTIIIIFIGITLFLLINYRKYFFNNIEYMFLIFSIFSGLSLIVSMPVSTNISWDDQVHFDRAYSKSTKYYNEAAMELNNPWAANFHMFNTNEENNAYMDHINEISNNEMENYTDRSIKYNELSYVPQSMVFFIGELINVDFSILFILGKLTNLIIYVTLVFFAIKNIPQGKYLIAVIALFPTAIYIACNYSYDWYVTGFLFLGFAYFYKELKNKNNELNKKNIIISIVSFCLGSLTKAVYIPIILVLLLIPKKKFNNKKHYKLFVISIILAFLLIMSTFVLPSLGKNVEGDSRGGNTSVSEQLSLIIHKPISYIKVFNDSAIESGLDKVFGDGGITSYAYLGNVKNKNIYYCIMILLILSIFAENNKESEYLKNKEKIWILVVLIMIVCLIWTALYLSFTPVGSLVINGVQSRYFIPLILPLLIIINTNKIKTNFNKERLYYVYIILLTIISFYPILFEILL